MNDVWKVVLSLSCSGTMLILGIFLLCRIFQKKMSRRWQYYIWFVAVIRLLVPFSGEINLVGRAFTEVEQYTENQSAQNTEVLQNSEDTLSETEIAFDLPESEQMNHSADSQKHGFLKTLLEYTGMIWFTVAVIMLTRKITVYQSFLRYIQTDSEPAGMELLERFGKIAEEMRMKGTVELYINSQISSPLLVGWLRPKVILTTAELSEPDFSYTALHELTHYRRMDILYKWLVQFAVCLHWFNPFVWLMEGEVDHACELACDEAVISRLTADEKRAYGDTLLHAADTEGTHPGSIGAVTLHESGRLLKGRLEAIMEYRSRSKWMTVLSLALAIGAAGSAAVLGAYAKPVTEGKHFSVGEEENLRFSSGGNDFLLEDGTDVIERDKVIYILCDGVPEEKVPAAGVVDGTMIMVVHRDYHTSVTLSDDRSEILGEAEEICKKMQAKGILSEEDAELILETAAKLQKREASGPLSDYFNGMYYQSVYYQAPYLFFVGYDLTEEAVKNYAGKEIILENGEKLHVSFADSDRIWMEDEELLNVLAAQFSEFRRRIGKRVARIQHPVISNVEIVGYDVESLAAKYYADDDIGYFSAMISELSLDSQKEYLEKAFQEDDAAVLSIVLGCLDNGDHLNDELIDSYVLRAYDNGNVAFFCILIDYLNGNAQREWYIRMKQENGRYSHYTRILKEHLEEPEEDDSDDELWDDLEDIWDFDW